MDGPEPRFDAALMMHGAAGAIGTPGLPGDQTGRAVHGCVVPNGDHFYTLAQAFAVERLLRWIDAG